MLVLERGVVLGEVAACHVETGKRIHHERWIHVGDKVVKMPKRGAGSAGFIGSRREQSIARSYTVENRHKDAIELQVLDAAPISEHEDVRVQSSYQPNPTSTEWRQQPGTVLWEQSLAAGGTQKFSASHTITWPKDQNLSDRH